MAVRFAADGQDYTRTLGLASTSQYSFSLWVRLAADRNAFSAALTLNDGVSFGSEVFLETDADGTTMALYSGGVKGARSLTVGTWYYFGVSVNGTNGTMVSRSLADTSFAVTTWTNGGAAMALNGLILGESRNGGEWLNGDLAAVKLWTGVTLTQAELEAEAGAYVPQRTAGLKAWYPLTQAETADHSGQGQTLSGGAGATTVDGPNIPWRQGRRRVILPQGFGASVTPAPVQGVASIPTPAISLGTRVQPGIVQGSTTIPMPDVFVGSSPPTNVQPTLVTGAASIPTPTITTVRNVTIAPVPLIGRAIILEPNVSVPIAAGDDLTGPGQLSYNGFKMGSGTRYSWQMLTGWWVDMPALDNGDMPDPSAHGSMPGQKLSGPRIITYESLIKAPKDEIEQAALDFLAGLPVPDADEQLPLAVQVLDQILIGYGACTQRAAPIDKRTRLGHIKAVAQFTLARPELYSRELLSATISDGGIVEVFNAGNTRTKPLIRCPGPAIGPELVVERILPDGSTDLRVLEFNLTIAAGETLIIDPAFGNATIGEVNKRRFRTGASVGIPDFVLGPGVSEVSYFTFAGGAPPATVLWRHAHL
ncbi:hypothetical protein [Streptosporangium minutum]|uniref:Uncharacterized protein n=1 Tax=Streptosporangium minutum TaxID=569862 RepID=A0A243RVX5_9ACTN|nr:hypothetical protein [Streptosporangium minutum]OUC99311.1 hypothetical protein CA984_03635 [Streptosporangium minutum]